MPQWLPLSGVFYYCSSYKNRNNHLELVDTRQICYCHTCSLKPLINGSISIVINSYHALDYRDISDESCVNKFVKIS